IDSKSLSRLGIPPWLSSALIHRQTWPFHRVDLTEQPEVIRLLCDLHEENGADRPAREDMLGVLLHTLLLRLYRLQPQSFRHTAGDTRMEEARLYIETHFADSFSIEELARRYYLSPSHFIARFGEYTGYTPQKYRKLCRMAHARYLLTEGDRSLSAIAESCGFSDLNSFVRSFRETMQITPGQYRELARGKKEPEL
ncbi:MAG: helix-turn-helix transcriptional regulator, partial [Clostridia bacterium]|nr:helix-turn-helix transcriptional regulator [Clostridia bacterium]